MTILFVLLALGVILVAALLAVGRLGALPEPSRDLAVPVLPAEPTSTDVEGLEFALGARGYRMDQVDAALDRLGETLEAKDRRIAELEAQVRGDEEQQHG